MTTGEKRRLLSDVRLFVLDLDGTLYLSDTPVEGAVAFVRFLAASTDRDYLIFSNNASRTADDYVKKLQAMGLDISADHVMTAGDVTAAYLLKHHKDARIYLNGTAALYRSWQEKGIRLVTEHPDICVQSFDKEMTYERMEKICTFIREGALFYATHKDINCPVEGGFIPDCGAMCALITASTGVNARYFGKPEKETLEMITERTGYEASGIAFVGDRIYTDVATGVLHGAKGFLVLSGESDMETVRTSDVTPTAVFSSVKEIHECLSDQ